jgi:ABC-type Fe3+/spermidine/putrescine transport system ATPase subunit
LTLSDRIAVINLGKLQQIGTPLDLYEKPECPFVADFIGINNLIPGEVQGGSDGEGRVKVKTGFGVLTSLTSGRLKTSDKCIICVRPETASISSSACAEEGLNCIPGAVSFASYIGNTVRYDVEIGQGLIFKVDVQNPWDHKPYPMGEKVYVSFPVKTSLGIPAQ